MDKNINDLETLPIAFTKKYKGDRVLFQSMDDLQIACGYNEKAQKESRVKTNKPFSTSPKEPILWRFRIAIISLILMCILIVTVIIHELTKTSS